MQLLNHGDLDRLYLKTLGAGHKTLAVTACDTQSGVTTMAMALAQRHLLAGHSVLYIELNSLAPSMTALCELDVTHTLKNAGGQTAIATPMLVTSRISDQVVTGVLAPQEQNHILALRNPNTLKQQLQRFGQDFDALVIDCAPLNTHNGNIDAAPVVPADLIATVADATLLIVQAGKTKAPHLKNAIKMVADQNITPTAIAMNNQFNPSLGQELIREAKRLEKILPTLSRWLTHKIRNSLLMLPL